MTEQEYDEILHCMKQVATVLKGAKLMIDNSTKPMDKLFDKIHVISGNAKCNGKNSSSQV